MHGDLGPEDAGRAGIASGLGELMPSGGGEVTAKRKRPRGVADPEAHADDALALKEQLAE